MEGGREVLMTLLVYCLYFLVIEVVRVMAEQSGNDSLCVILDSRT